MATGTTISGIPSIVNFGIETVAPLAQVAWNAIPTPGPVIDAAIPALNVIFNNDTSVAALEAQEQKQAEDPSKITEHFTEDSSQQLAADLHNSDGHLPGEPPAVLDNLNPNTERKNANISATLANLDEHPKNDFFEEMKHVKVMEGYTTIMRARYYLAKKQDSLATLTANSGYEKFRSLLDASDENLIKWRETLVNHMYAIGVQLAETRWMPTKEMLDLFVLLIHWVLVFRRANIVVMGVLAKSHFVGERYQEYFQTLEDVDAEISGLKTDSQVANEVLLTAINKLLGARRASVGIKHQFLRSNPPAQPDEMVCYYLQDSWPSHAIGYFTPTEMKQILKDGSSVEEVSIIIKRGATEELDNQAKNTLNTSPGMGLYKETVKQRMEEYMKTYQAVADFLGESLKEWNRRIPIAPKTTLPDRQFTVTASQANAGQPIADEYLRNRFKYRVTYLSEFGESIKGSWSDSITPGPKITEITLTFTDIEFEDQSANNAGTNKAQSNRGFRRRIYVKYLSNPTKRGDKSEAYELLGEVDEHERTFVHDLVRKEEALE